MNDLNTSDTAKVAMKPTARLATELAGDSPIRAIFGLAPLQQIPLDTE